jgi:hypothetical protein
MKRWLPALMLSAFVLGFPLLADDAPAAPFPAGSWKMILPSLREVGAQPLWLLKLESMDGKWTGSVVATRERFAKGELKKLVVGKDRLTFALEAGELSLSCEFRLVKGERLLGTAFLKGTPLPVELESTTISSLDPFDLAREALAKKAPGFDTVKLALGLLQQSEVKKVKPTEVRSWAEKAVKSAELYGPLVQRNTLLSVAEILADEKGFEAIGLQYAQRAERMLEEKESPTAQKKVLEVLANSLEKAGKKEDAVLVQARLKKLDFRIKPKTFAGRKGKSERVVLAELFTGAECVQCVAADLAAEALARTFKPAELIVLRYHLNSPNPDPLAGEATEMRRRFYDEALRGLPQLILDGRTAVAEGGSPSEAQEKYEDYYDAITGELEKPARAEVSVTATRKEDTVSITAKVAKAAETGDDVRLRLVLVEDAVAFKGGNGRTVHQNVVRAMPGGDQGTVLAEKTLEKTFTVDLAELRKKHTAYLDKQAEKRPYPQKERPLELKKLRVVAFVQNDKTGEILQSALTDVK